MRKATFAGVLASAMMLSTAAANATLIFQATLSGAAQGSSATGAATVTLENDNTTLDVDVTFSGLIGGPATAAHIHCCAPATGTAPVVLPFTGFPSAPSGTYVHTFDLTTDLTGITVASFLANLESGLAYVNIHNTQFPAGEIRGQLALVPEPSAIGILGLGAVAVFTTRRRRSVPAASEQAELR
jgi:hypothetical protein